MRPAKILTTPILSYARMRAHSSGLRNSLAGCPRGNPSRSQSLMRWRVMLQFIAIIVIMATLWLMGR